MTYLAIRMLIGDTLKYIGLIAGIAFASFMINQQASIFMGYTSRTKAWISDMHEADLWVMDPQLEFSEDRKPILPFTLQRIRGVQGVEWAVPMYKGFVTGKLSDGTTKQIRMIGIDDATLIGGPAKMISGSILDVRRDRGILIDANDLNSTLVHQVDPSHAQPLKIGSSITVNDHEAIVTGIFERSREFFWEPVIYTTYSRAVQFSLPERRSLSYVLVKLQNPADAIHIQKVIHETTGLRVMTSDEFGSFTMWFILLQTGILINFGITIALGIVIGALVAGQLFYTFILDNLRHYAALKAMGVTNSAMKRFVMVQVLFVGAVGYGIGLGMASIVGFFAAGGSLAFRMTWHVPLVSLAAIGMCCILASRVSLYRVFNTETAVVFK